jgi:hypothetical protein
MTRRIALSNGDDAIRQLLALCGCPRRVAVCCRGGHCQAAVFAPSVLPTMVAHVCRDVVYEIERLILRRNDSTETFHMPSFAVNGQASRRIRRTMRTYYARGAHSMRENEGNGGSYFTQATQTFMRIHPSSPRLPKAGRRMRGAQLWRILRIGIRIADP